MNSAVANVPAAVAFAGLVLLVVLLLPRLPLLPSAHFCLKGQSQEMNILSKRSNVFSICTVSWCVCAYWCTYCTVHEFNFLNPLLKYSI